MRRSVASIVVLAMVLVGGVTSGSEGRPLRRFESAGPASALGPTEVIYSNFGPDMAFDTNPNHGWGTYMGNDGSRQAISQQFTPAGDYTFRTAQVAVSLYKGPSSLHVYLQADSSGLPGAVMEEILIGGLGSTAAVVTATSVLSPTLYKDTPYWLTLVAVGNAVSVGWIWNSVGDASSTTIAFTQGEGAAGPWSIGWFATRSAFQINGTPTTPEPQPTSTPATPEPQPTSTPATPEPQPTSTPPTPGLQSAIYLPLVMRSPLFRIAFTSNRDRNTEIYVMNADGSSPTNLTNNPKGDGGPVWSPDGRQIAFISDRDGNAEIYVMNADGSSPTNLTNNPKDDRGPVWSPDGRKIAFISERDGNAEIYVMNADGSSQTNLTNNPKDDRQPVWSPDGRQIAFVSGSDFSSSEIYKMDADGSNRINITKNQGAYGGPAWSPDGRQIAFVYWSEIWSSEIYKMDADGSNRINITKNQGVNGSPTWSPDGRQIAFVYGADVWSSEIYKMDADGSNQTRLTNISLSSSGPVWSPDGGQIAFTTIFDWYSEIYVVGADGSNLTNFTTTNIHCNWLTYCNSDPAWSPTMN